MLVMKQILFMIVLGAGVMYAVLHSNLWTTNSFGLSSLSRKHCNFKTNVSTFLTMDNFCPFLCESNFYDISASRGNNKFELPYGVRRSEMFFQRALSQLERCDLFLEDKSSSSCKKCIVVGNGGILRNKNLGQKIDSYDVVIRMNNGPVIGYENDVGRKTTYRLFYPESIFSDPLHYDPKTIAVFIVFKRHDLKWLSDLLSGHNIMATNVFWKKPAMKMIYKPNQIRILDPFIIKRTAYELLRFPRKFPRRGRPKHPTTGLIAIAFAFDICTEVHVAGFKYNLQDPGSSLHYYGNDTMSLMIKNEYHDIDAEQRLLKNLIDQQIVINLTE
ncbi:type 2 lactosamine alpha-2,3-sialyltransferase isoform X1 [Notechis scutatus]|uniref:Type 2 lactosamine alpha-2,3-sialyltransferase n=2 Tax=Notechis scutatus TaxID=8663 RepID=A0A6J1VA12_9SAUR|nr:type 2 lactosamine alpha-2,3-sialyltransferase isoform X1 [Notechis scutatus]XP_026537534.1 type 2 lactosamine alpha-2,3-sialyltransferase isoform X1 [Notechis scutatus]XP_026537535.1 type 2 lactosamine alpha-2,3-sialyltransferase isoform X1 [Notechis scutatus]